eukprot:scaffold100081_cov30-Prasinocladus_malaysianus.AAC.1
MNSACNGFGLRLVRPYEIVPAPGSRLSVCGRRNAYKYAYSLRVPYEYKQQHLGRRHIPRSRTVRYGCRYGTASKTVVPGEACAGNTETQPSNHGASQ